MRLKFLTPALFLSSLMMAQPVDLKTATDTTPPALTPVDLFKVNLEDDPYAARMDSLLYMGFF